MPFTAKISAIRTGRRIPGESSRPGARVCRCNCASRAAGTLRPFHVLLDPPSLPPRRKPASIKIRVIGCRPPIQSGGGTWRTAVVVTHLRQFRELFATQGVAKTALVGPDDAVGQRKHATRGTPRDSYRPTVEKSMFDPSLSLFLTSRVPRLA